MRIKSPSDGTTSISSRSRTGTVGTSDGEAAPPATKKEPGTTDTCEMLSSSRLSQLLDRSLHPTTAGPMAPVDRGSEPTGADRGVVDGERLEDSRLRREHEPIEARGGRHDRAGRSAEGRIGPDGLERGGRGAGIDPMGDHGKSGGLAEAGKAGMAQDLLPGGSGSVPGFPGQDQAPSGSGGAGMPSRPGQSQAMDGGSFDWQVGGFVGMNTDGDVNWGVRAGASGGNDDVVWQANAGFQSDFQFEDYNVGASGQFGTGDVDAEASIDYDHEDGLTWGAGVDVVGTDVGVGDEGFTVAGKTVGEIVDMVDGALAPNLGEPIDTNIPEDTEATDDDDSVPSDDDTASRPDPTDVDVPLSVRLAGVDWDQVTFDPAIDYGPPELASPAHPLGEAPTAPVDFAVDPGPPEMATPRRDPADLEGKGRPQDPAVDPERPEAGGGPREARRRGAERREPT